MMADNLVKAIKDIRSGKPIVLTDDIDRENEGDIVISAQFCTKENLAFCIKESSGLMCIATTGDILDKLNLPMMILNSSDKNNTPFTISVDASDQNVTTGMSVDDRLLTISKFIKDELNPRDLNRPGHLFPLRARSGLLNDRRGHTEGAVCLMYLCALKPVAIISEIINNDGTMCRGELLKNFSYKHQLSVISIEEVYNAYKNS